MSLSHSGEAVMTPLRNGVLGGHDAGCSGSHNCENEALGEVWRAAEAALPEGWAMAGIYHRLRNNIWRARAYRKGAPHVYAALSPDIKQGDGPTPAAALQALIETLRATQ